MVVAVSDTPKKVPCILWPKRIDFVKRVLGGIENVEVVSFNCLLVDVAKKAKAKVIVKGLRAISDFEYEFQMAQINKKLNPEVETMFLMTNPRYAYLSSSGS
ncbi:MAG: pantetheine-phosphate adenylyltransferase [Actinomycetota bacterium]|nr:pantetheine-phosphate adenylyltransferase [Actinomycetota bacterium]